MTLPVRLAAVAVCAAVLWGNDAVYHDRVLTPQLTAAAVRQADGSGTAALADLHARGRFADGAAVVGTVAAAGLCLLTWRPRPRTVYVDQRTKE